LRSSNLWFVARDGTLIGRAAITFGSETNRFLLGSPSWDGFDGYVTQSNANEIILAAVNEAGAVPIARLELRP
jgi:hypothetical protein